MLRSQPAWSPQAQWVDHEVTAAGVANPVTEWGLPTQPLPSEVLSLPYGGDTNLSMPRAVKTPYSFCSTQRPRPGTSEQRAMKPKTDPQQEAELVPWDEEQRETGNAEGRERAVQGRSDVSVLALGRPWYPTELELQLHSSERKIGWRTSWNQAEKPIPSLPPLVDSALCTTQQLTADSSFQVSQCTIRIPK